MIKKTEYGEEYYFEEGCYITELSNCSNEPEISIAKARVKPGKVTRWHRLNGITERYVIVEGQGQAEVDDLPPQKVSVGDVVLIRAAQAQRIHNTGTNDLIFLAICTPRFVATCYENLER